VVVVFVFVVVVVVVVVVSDPSPCSWRARARARESTVPVLTYLPAVWNSSSLAPQMHSASTVTYCALGKSLALSQLAHSGLAGMHVLSLPSRWKAARQKALQPVDAWW
jgi:hypothetical protein